MFKQPSILSILTMIGSVSLAALLLTACSSDTGGNTTATEPPASTASAVASVQPSTPAADLPNPSDNAIALAELEQTWELDVPDGEEDPCPCEYGSTLMNIDEQQAILPLVGNHATITYHELTLGEYGQADFYLVARDRYVGDTNPSVNFEGFTYEAWLVSMGDLINAEGSRVAASVAVIGQDSISEAYRKGKLLSRYAKLTPNEASEPVETSNAGVALSKVDFRTQTATLENRTGDEVDLKGWRLEGTNKREVYFFSEGAVLQAGQSLNVRAGLTGGMTSNSHDIVWGNNRFPWVFDGDQAILRNADEQIVSHIEAPNLQAPIIIGKYEQLPITKKVTSNKGVKEAIERLNALSGGADAYRLSEAKEAATSDGRTVWMLLLRPGDRNEGEFADVRVDPENGELLSVYGLAEQTELNSSTDSAGELAKRGNELLRKLTGDDSADYRIIDLVEMPGYVILTLAQGHNDEYRVIHSDEKGFTSVTRSWMDRW